MKTFAKLCLAGETKTLRHALRDGVRHIPRAYAALSSISVHFRDPPGPGAIRDDEIEPLVAATYMVVLRAETRTIDEPQLHKLTLRTLETMDNYITHRELFT